jgi:single-stranded-DNA-specific exonuclease
LPGIPNCEIRSRELKEPDDDTAWACTDVLKKIFLGRNVTNTKEIEYPLSRLLTPSLFKGGEHAARIVVDALVQSKHILILGDYDTDGATATALGLLALKKMGAQQIDYLVPNRFEYGYGLSLEIARVAIKRSPDLVITVDNGISSVEGVQCLKDAGIEVIVTDHHLAGDRLPNADAILNPNQPGCDFPSKSLAGVGVMFYLLLMVRAHLKQQGWFELNKLPVPNLADYLDLVALGTVADVVPLDYNNRILVSQGIARIRLGKCRPGIAALMEVGGKHYGKTVSSDFGFVIAPRLNAAGRLDDISMGIECLLAEDGNIARQYAVKLNEINIERKEIEQEMQIQALKIVKTVLSSRDPSITENGTQSGFCLYDNEWHQGITGLVASRVKDKTSQPVIAFARTTEGKLTGSARSVPGLHFKDLLENIATTKPELIEKFGGHAMAAGLTIQSQNLDAFRKLFYQKVAEHFQLNGMENALLTDGTLEGDDLSLRTAQEIRDGAPWGQGFPEPLFEGVFLVIDSRLLRGQHLKMSLLSEESAQPVDAIAFRAVEPGMSCPQLNKIKLVYQLDVNDFRGRKSMQLIIRHIESLND